MTAAASELLSEESLGFAEVRLYFCASSWKMRVRVEGAPNEDATEMSDEKERQHTVDSDNEVEGEIKAGMAA